MKVLLIEPLAKPRLVEIDGSLESMQRLVQGDIEALYPWDDLVGLVCNDEGKINGLPANRMLEDYDIICGPFFIAGLSADNFASIPDDLAKKYTEKFQYPELFMRRMDGRIICFRMGSGEEPTII